MYIPRSVNMAHSLLISIWIVTFLHSLSISDVKAIERNKPVSFQYKDQYGHTVLLRYENAGCFADKSDRALRHMYYDARSNDLRWDEWPNTTNVIKACAVNAYMQGYRSMFGVQFYGECWSDGSVERNFYKYGPSKNCVHGVGRDWANNMYRLTVVPLKSTAVQCLINGREYNEGDSMEISINWEDNPSSAECQTCTCRDGKAEDCTSGIVCELGFQALCQRYKNVPDQCCPVCDCYHNNEVKPMGSSWIVRKGELCSECVCAAREGYNIANCTTRALCPLCYGEQLPNPGKCCPKCVPKPTTIEPPFIITTRPKPVFPFFKPSNLP